MAGKGPAKGVIKGPDVLSSVLLDTSNAERQLNGFLTKLNKSKKQLTIDVGIDALKNAKTIWDSMVKEMSQFGETDIFNNMAKTFDNAEKSFKNMIVTLDGKELKGLVEVVKSLTSADFDKISKIDFGIPSLHNNVLEAKKIKQVTDQIIKSEEKLAKVRTKNSRKSDVTEKLNKELASIKRRVNSIANLNLGFRVDVGTVDEISKSAEKLQLWTARLVSCREELEELKKSNTEISKDMFDSIENAINTSLDSINDKIVETTKMLKTSKVADVDIKKNIDSNIKKLKKQIAVKKEAEEINKTSLRTQEQVNAELKKEEETLKRIEVQEKKNEAAREEFKRKQANYGKEVLGIDHAVYDIDLVKGAAKELKEFNELLEVRNKFQEKYIKLCNIIENYYIDDKPGKYSIGNGLYKNLDQFFEESGSDIKWLERLSENGQQTTNKTINEAFKNVVRGLQSDLDTISRMISSGEVSGALIGQDLDREEIELNKEMQRLYDARIEQENKISKLKREELDLTKQIGQEEAKNTRVRENQTRNTKQLAKEIAEAQLKLTKKPGSDVYTAMDGKYEIGQDADGWKVWQRDNAEMLNLIGTYKHFEDIKNDVSLLTREEIVYTDEVIKEINALRDAYGSIDKKLHGHMSTANKYIELMDQVKSGAMSSADAIEELSKAIGGKGFALSIDNKKQDKEVGTIDHLVESLNKLDSLNLDPLNEIVESIVAGEATISAEVQEILKSINLLNDAGEFTGKYITEGMNNNGVITNDKYAIIARTQEHYDEPESYDYDFTDGTTYIDNLIAKEQEAAEQGVNLARVLQRVKSEAQNGQDLFYEIQEFAPGSQIHAFDENKKNIQDFEKECARLTSASSEHIQKLMSDIIKLNELGFFIDFSPANILYDTAKGFSLIDLSLRDLGLEAQTTTELMEGLATCLIGLEGNEERINPSLGDGMRWNTSMLSVYNKLGAIFGKNNFGVDFGSIASTLNDTFTKYITQAEQKILDTELKRIPVIEDNIDAKQEQVKQAQAQLEAEKKITAEIERQQDLFKQSLLEDFDEIGYISPYTSEQIGNLTIDTNFDKMLNRFGVSKENQSQIVDKFNQWASMIAEQREFENKGWEPVDDLPAMIDETMSEIADMVMKFGSTRQPIEKRLEDFYEYAKGIRVQYNESDVAEFGSEWPEILRSFGRGRYAVLTQDRSAMTINDRWGELLEMFPSLFDVSVDNEKDQLKAFIEALRAARNEHQNKAKTETVDLPDYAFKNIMYDLSGSYHTIEINTENMLSGLSEAVKKENEFADAANRSSKAIEEQAKTKKKIVPEMSIDALTGGIESEALKKLREASSNETLFVNLKAVFKNDDLELQIRNMIQDIGDWGDLSLGKISVSSKSDDIINIDLYNDKMQTTINQTWQLVEATEEADAHIRLVGEAYTQNIKALDQQNQKISDFKQRASEQIKSWTEEGYLGKDNLFSKTSEIFDVNGNKISDLSQEITQFQSTLNSVGEGSNLKQLEQDFSNISNRANEAAKSYQTFLNASSKDYYQNNYQYTNGKTYADQVTLDSMRDYYKQEEAEAQQFNLDIKRIYSELMSTMKQINDLDVKINDFSLKDSGSGLYSKTISALQQEKSTLVAQLRSISDEINNSLNVTPEENGISKFFDIARERAALTSEEIQKFDNLLKQSEEIGYNFGAKLIQQIQPVVDKINSLKQMITNGTIDKNSDIAKNVLSTEFGIMDRVQKFKDDPSAFAAIDVKKYVNDISEYINVLYKAAQAEQKYFAGKAKYISGDQSGTYDEYITKQIKATDGAQQKLEAAAKQFTQDSGLGDAIITRFSKTADGISRIDFSAFDSGANILRNFHMEMGTVTDGIYRSETTINKSLANIQAAQKQLQSAGSLIGTLDSSSVNIKNDGSTSAQVQKLLDLYRQLSAEVSKGDGADQNKITKLTKDLKLAASETEKFYKQMIQMDDAIASGQLKDLGKGNVNGNVYNQLVDATKQLVGSNQNATVEFGKFDTATNILNASLVNANGTVENFKVSMNALNGQMTAQQAGVGKLSTTWDSFKSIVSGAGKQLTTALLGYNVFYKAISEVRNGINYVKEIDLAMTELKKVTDETEESYSNFLSTAGSTAGNIGSTVSDFIDATANFARLGYTIEESAKMAETAIVYKNVADGLDTVEESTDSIISTMMAYGIAADDTMGIIDRFNAVGKTYCPVM